MKTRKESFLGLHFDFHAQPKYGTQGVNLKEEDIRTICRSFRPDFIQIDCKGHPGWTSPFPSLLSKSPHSYSSNQRDGHLRLITPTEEPWCRSSASTFTASSKL